MCYQWSRGATVERRAPLVAAESPAELGGTAGMAGAVAQQLQPACVEGT